MATPQVLAGVPQATVKKPQPIGGLPAAGVGAPGPVPPSPSAAPLAGGAGGGMPTAPTTPKVTTQTVGVQSGAGSGGVGSVANGTGFSANAGAPATPDPFAAMGGGVRLGSGDWVPKDHPLAASALKPTVAPAALTPTAPKAAAPPLPPAAPPSATSVRPPTPTTTSPAPTTPKPAALNPADPFAAMGGGVKLASGDWVPKDHPLAKAAGQTATAATTAAPATAAATAAKASADPFAAMGGGVQLPGGEWVPKDHPLAKTAGATPATTAATGGTATTGTTTTAGATPAATAPPITTADQTTASTTNAGQQIGQGQPTTIAQSFQQALVNKLNPGAVDINNPAIATSIQANRLAEQRGREQAKNALAEQAARSGTSMSGGNAALERGIIADSAMRQGQYEGDKLQHLQDQQDQALLAALGLSNQTLQTNAGRAQQESQFGRTLDEQKRQSDIDAELRKLGINTQGSLGSQDIALRGRLGDQSANLSLLGLLMSNDQFGRQLNQQGNQFSAGLDQSGLMGLLGLL